MAEASRTWLAADYHLPSSYSCRVPMSSMTSALALPGPGPATVRLALIRTGIERYGLAQTQDTLFATIRAMRVRVRPPERVALTAQVLHAYKLDEQAGREQASTAPISREVAHAQGPLTVYLEVPRTEEDRWAQLLQAIGYWGQASSFACCLGVQQREPDPRECATPLRSWRGSGRLGACFSSILAELRDDALSWDEVLPTVGVPQPELLRLDVYVWPLLTVEQHAGGKLLRRIAFA